MRAIRHEATLVYYDGMQVILAKDPVGTRYVCLLVEQTATSDSFMCVPISPERFGDLANGRVDLRDIFTDPEVPGVWLASGITDGGELALKPIASERLSSGWLPDKGFTLVTEVATEEVLQEALSRRRAIVEIALSPPEARGEAKISAPHLSVMLTLFQSIVKHSFRKAISNMQSEARKALDSPENYGLEVLAFARGSFRITLQSSGLPDMFGHLEIEKAFMKLDEITEHVDDPEIAVAVVRQNKGHLAGAYFRLLEFVVQNNAPFTYRWATPNSAELVSRQLAEKQASALYDKLGETKELVSEEVEFIGRIREVDVDRKTWRIQNYEDGKPYHGSLPDNSQLSLGGIVVDEDTYRFVCEERIEEVVVTGKEKRTYLLLSFEQVGINDPQGSLFPMNES